MRWGRSTIIIHTHTGQEQKEPPHHTQSGDGRSGGWKHNQRDFLSAEKLAVRVEEETGSAGGFRECLAGVTGYGWHEITNRHLGLERERCWSAFVGWFPCKKSFFCGRDARKYCSLSGAFVLKHNKKMVSTKSIRSKTIQIKKCTIKKLTKSNFRKACLF